MEFNLKYPERADVDNNSVIDAQDAALVLSKALNSEFEFKTAKIVNIEKESEKDNQENNLTDDEETDEEISESYKDDIDLVVSGGTLITGETANIDDKVP